MRFLYSVVVAVEFSRQNCPLVVRTKAGHFDRFQPYCELHPYDDADY